MGAGTTTSERGQRGPRETSARRRSRLSLVLILGMFVVGALIEATPTTATLFGVHGPTCPSRWLLPNVGCPGCGLTRGTALILDGRFTDAVAVQPCAWLVVVFGAAAALLHGIRLARPKKSAWIDRPLGTGRVLFVVGLLAFWLGRLAFGAA